MFSGNVTTLKEYSSDLVLHFQKVEGLTKDRFKKKTRTKWKQPGKTLDSTFPLMQFDSIFH